MTKYNRLSGLNNRKDLLAVLEAGVSVSAWSGPGEASPPTIPNPWAFAVTLRNHLLVLRRGGDREATSQGCVGP